MTDKNQEEIDELHEKADEFSKRFAKAHYESGEAQQFMRNFCEVFGINTYSSIQFEDKIKLKKTEVSRGGINRIDGFLPRMLLIEMKSGGKDLVKAGEQAFRYIRLLEEDRPEDVPRYVMVSDFKTIDLYDRNVSEVEPTETIKLSEFRNHLDKFYFLLDYKRIVECRQEELNIKAAEKLAALHDSIKKTEYDGKNLEILLVRILFCLFAEDTGLFAEQDQFYTLINKTHTDATDLYGALDLLFISLDAARRPKSMYSNLRAFPYVNGDLFKGRLDPCYFSPESRADLLACSEIDWSQISPEIFGSLFQFIMHFEDNDTATKSKKRREFGAHYTSEKNIFRTIGPLFLDDLKQELKDCKGDSKKLQAYLGKLRQLHFFDPACGCGNFLVVAYRELRMLEEKALNEVKKGQLLFDMPLCNVNQFYGIEIDPSAAQIATLALWLVDHQMNMRCKNPDGTPYLRLPLTEKANIECGNALQMDWESVIPAQECSYVFGNPPFIGAKFMGDHQRADILKVCEEIKNFGLLDYVSAWYVKSVRFLKKNPDVTAAFVSTNSITQGEQVGVLWKWMLAEGVKIHFAHRTFRWSNEGKGLAAVHCVIICFGLLKTRRHLKIFDYPDINGEPVRTRAKNINPYLVNAPNLVLERRNSPICNVPSMSKGNQPTDGGHLILSIEERNSFLTAFPKAAHLIKRLIGAKEFLHSEKRYCLWLVNASQNELNRYPFILERIEKCRRFRAEEGVASDTKALAETPTVFRETRNPESYVIIPSVSSEKRAYVPFGFETSETIATNLCLVINDATLYHFGILTSTMHNAWMKAVCGRLESRYRYSAGIVYNNFPWPQSATEKQTKDVEKRAQKVLDVRKGHEGKTLAWMYNPETMPNDLRDAHNALDAAVDACYGYGGGKDDTARVAYLFGLYGDLMKRHTAFDLSSVGEKAEL